MLNFQGSLFLVLEMALEIPKLCEVWLTQFCGISRGEALLCLEFPEAK